MSTAELFALDREKAPAEPNWKTASKIVGAAAEDLDPDERMPRTAASAGLRRARFAYVGDCGITSSAFATSDEPLKTTS